MGLFTEKTMMIAYIEFRLRHSLSNFYELDDVLEVLLVVSFEFLHYENYLTFFSKIL